MGIQFSDLSRKHCGKRRNCSLRAISSFPTMFSMMCENEYLWSKGLSVMIAPKMQVCLKGVPKFSWYIQNFRNYVYSAFYYLIKIPQISVLAIHCIENLHFAVFGWNYLSLVLCKSAEPHSSVGSNADLRRGGGWFDPLLGQYSFQGLMIVIATGFISLSPLLTMVMCESSQWLGKNIEQSTG